MRRSTLAVTFLFAACGTVHTIPLGTKAYPPRPPEHQVPIYESVGQLPPNYERIGRVHITTGDFSPYAAALLRRGARELGADALVLLPGTPSACTCSEGGSNELRQSALAVRWR